MFKITSELSPTQAFVDETRPTFRVVQDRKTCDIAICVVDRAVLKEPANARFIAGLVYLLPRLTGDIVRQCREEFEIDPDVVADPKPIDADLRTLLYDLEVAATVRDRFRARSMS